MLRNGNPPEMEGADASAYDRPSVSASRSPRAGERGGSVMDSDRRQRIPERASYSSRDLRQVREAAGELRASGTESFLAELVEEKLRMIEESLSFCDESGLPAPPWIPVAWSA